MALRFSGAFAYCVADCPRVTDSLLATRLSNSLNKVETNEFLPFYAISTRAITDADEHLLLAQSHLIRSRVDPRQRSLQSLPNMSKADRYQNIPLPLLMQLKAFLDSGASCNICSLRFAKAGGFHVERAGQKEITAFRGESTTEELWRAIFIIEIDGHLPDGTPSVLQILTSALIVADDMDTPLILGAEFQHEHGIVSDPRRRMATLRDSKGQAFHVNWADMGNNEYQQLKVATAQLIENKSSLESNGAIRQGMMAGFSAATDRTDEQWAAIDPVMLLHTAVTESRQFLAYAGRHRFRLTPFICRALSIMVTIYRSDALRVHAKLLDNMAYDKDGRELPMFKPITIDPLQSRAVNTAYAVVHTALHLLVHQPSEIPSDVPVEPARCDFRAAAAQFKPAVTSSVPRDIQFPGTKDLGQAYEVIHDMFEAMDEQAAKEHHCLVIAAARSQWPIRATEAPLFIPEPVDLAFLLDPKITDNERVWRHVRQYATLDFETLPDEGEHADLLQCLREECTRLSPQLRPDNFPASLWPLVADSQKPSIKARWSRYSPERIEHCLADILVKIRIYDGDPARAEQKSFICAQVVANLDRFYHPSDDESPTIPGVEMEIVLTDPDCRPVNFQNRRLQPWERLSLRARIAIMRRQGLIEETKSAWNNPVHMVANKDRIKAFQAKYGAEATTIKLTSENEEEIAGLYRMTGDFRLLNSLSHLERWPLPRIMDLIDSCIEKSNRYSSHDLANAFFLIRLKESWCRHLTAFGTPDAHLQYAVMPQGVKSSANFWARTIQNIMSDLLYAYKILVYQDDVVNTAKNFGEHFRTQQALYDRLGLKGIVFKPGKTTLNYTSQKILGHIMSAEGRGVDPGLIETIIKLGPPRNLHDVQSMLGLAKVATEYVPGLSAMLAPIQELAKKYLDIPALWAANPLCDIALADLKQALISTEVLLIPDITRPFRVAVDACRVGRGLGAVLKQPVPEDDHLPLDQRRWKPVAYWSRALSDAERNFSATELEATGVHDSIMHWYPFLYMTFHEFEVLTDHYALVYLVTKMGKSVQSHQRLTRLCLDLQGYTFSVRHIKGTDHLDADAVSRLLHHDEVAFVHNEDTLRSDSGPLTENDRVNLEARYKQDAEWLIRTIERREKEQAIARDQPAVLVALALCRQPVANSTLPLVSADRCAPECTACGDVNTTTSGSLFARECARPIMAARARLLPKLQHPSEAPKLSIRQLDSIISDSDFQLQGIDPERQARLLQYLRLLHEQIIHPLEPHAKPFSHAPISEWTVTVMLLHRQAVGLSDWQAEQYTELGRALRASKPASAIISRTNRSLRRQRRRHRERTRLHLIEQIRAHDAATAPRSSKVRGVNHEWRETESVEQHYQHKLQMETILPYLLHAVVARQHRLVRAQLHQHSRPWVPVFHPAPAVELPAEALLSFAALRLLVGRRLQQIHREQACFHFVMAPEHQLNAPVAVPGQLIRAMFTSIRPYKIHPASTIEAPTIEHQRRLVLSQVISHPLRLAPARVARAPTPPPIEIIQVPHYGTRRAQADYDQAEGARQEMLDNRLEEYQYLHGQVYLDPVSKVFYEVIDTVIKRRHIKNGGTAVTVVSWPINADGELAITEAQQNNETQWQERPFREVMELIDAQTRVTDRRTGMPFPMTDDEWSELQLADAWCRPIMDKLDGSNHFNLHPSGRRDDRHYDRLHRPLITNADGTTRLGPLTRSATVHQKVQNGAIEMTRFSVIDQIVVPEQMYKAVLYQHHTLIGHAGSHRMTKTTRLKYWWKTIVKDCIEFSQKCRYCEMRKARNHNPKAPIQEYPAPPSPHHTAHIDLTGPFNESHGHKYVLVYKCALTKWVECVALKDKTASAVVNGLSDIFMRHGAPVRLIMDNGREFKNKICKAACDLLEARMIHITPVNPRSNGLAENQMRTLKDMVSAHCDPKQSNWSECLSAVAHVYNTTVNHATGYTPFYLNHGRQCSSPDTEYLTNKIKSLDDHALSLAQALKMAWDTLAGSTWSDKTDVLNRRTVQPLEFKHYEINQLCFIKRIPRRFYKDIQDEEKYKISAKLLARYAGPYRIIEKKSEVVYIAMVHGQRRAIHAINMKPAMVDLHVAAAQPDPIAAQAELDREQQEEINADAILLRALRGVELNPPRPPQPTPTIEPSAPRIMRKLSPVIRQQEATPQAAAGTTNNPLDALLQAAAEQDAIAALTTL